MKIVKGAMAKLLLFVFLVYMVYTFISGNLNRISGQYEYQLQENGQQVAGEVCGRMKDALVMVQSLAETFSDYSDIHSSESVRQLLRVSEKTGFTRMWLTKLDGVAISSEGIKSDASGRAYLADVSKGNSGISGVQESKVNGERNVVIYAPIYHNEEITGTLIGIFSLEMLNDVIDLSYFDNQGDGKIFDQNGTILVQNQNADDFIESNNLLSFFNEVELSQNKPIDSIRRDLAQYAASGVTYTVNGTRHHGYYCPIGINDWFMYVSLPDAIITSYTTENIREAVILCLSFIVVLLILLALYYTEKSKQLKRQAQLDGLTSILNRGALQERIKSALEDDKYGVSAMIIMDVDKFKRVNDTFGHLAGDEILICIGELMQKKFAQNCIYGRFGGDEFVVLISNVTDKETIYHQVEDFQEAVTKLRISQYPDARFSVSMGIAFSDQDGRDFEQLFEEADTRMYQNKKRIV